MSADGSHRNWSSTATSTLYARVSLLVCVRACVLLFVYANVSHVNVCARACARMTRDAVAAVATRTDGSDI